MITKTLHPGDRVTDKIGHRYDILEVRAGGYVLYVQALTPRHDGVYVPIGQPFVMGRSDLRA
ncbi:MAG TPA: hypothetical protein VN903_17725 [Polyangia bacterium]|nr:hypothetical protein [Polyangia bacterium]